MSALDPETLQIVRQALDEAWALVPQDHKNKYLKIDMADRVLTRAAAGDFDLARAAALMGTGQPDVGSNRFTSGALR